MVYWTHKIVLSESVCSSKNFVCANGNCLEESKMCDYHDDCGDGSDEGTICSGIILVSKLLDDQRKKSRYCLNGVRKFSIAHF